MEIFLGISAKIEDKSKAKMKIYPQGRMWFNKKDQSRVDKVKSEFEEKHMSSLYQSHLFEKMCNGDMRGAIALAE